MMNKFNLMFKDPDVNDWYITLHTSEPQTNEEIMDLILTYAEMISNGYLSECYCPTDIMDRLCDAMQDDGRDWWWENMNVEIVEIKEW